MTEDHWASKTWRPFGKSDPYYGVLSQEKFRSHRMDDATRREFFATGEEHVELVLDTIRASLVPDFRPRRVLDFGSGVGRLLIPFARVAESVLGVDISPEMITEAKKNCAAAGLTNVDVVLSDDRLSQVRDKFDLVHSYIVIQHIPPARGVKIFRELVDRIAPGGVGALHVTYARAAPAYRRIIHRLRRRIAVVNAAVNVIQRRPLSEPLIPMYVYDLHGLLGMLHALGHEHVRLILTDHGGHQGAMLLFRVPGPVTGQS